MYDNILVPIDGSGIRKKSLEELEELSLRNNPRVHLISVVDYSVFDNSGPTDAERVACLDEEECEKALEKSSKTVRNMGHQVKNSIVKGWPASSIIDYAEKNNIDIIIMTTHGEKNITESVTHKVIDETDIPVLVRGEVKSF